jgi:hypothetical protein
MPVTYLDTQPHGRINFFDASVPSYTTLATNTTTTTITLIPTTAAVGDIVYFQQFTTPYSGPWKDSIFDIVQPLLSGEVTGVWEYSLNQNGGSWSALPNVDGTKSFTLTGLRRLVFDQPDDHRDLFNSFITGSLNGIAAIRFRITAVTSITQACTIDVNDSKHCHNALYVDGYTSGTPCIAKNLHDADIAGTRILAPSLPCTTSMLIHNIRPAEKGALRVKFTLSGTTAGAGDTIDITGIGADGEAVTESISVAAGNGVYQSARSYSSITSFSCTGW